MRIEENVSEWTLDENVGLCRPVPDQGTENLYFCITGVQMKEARSMPCSVGFNQAANQEGLVLAGRGHLLGKDPTATAAPDIEIAFSVAD